MHFRRYPEIRRPNSAEVEWRKGRYRKRMRKEKGDAGSLIEKTFIQAVNIHRPNFAFLKSHRLSDTVVGDIRTLSWIPRIPLSIG